MYIYSSSSSTMTSINDMPVEILANILVSTVTRALTGDETPLYLTRITSTLRNVALATPDLWQFLFTTCRIYSLRHDTLVPASYVHFLGWWSNRLGNRNQLALRFNVDFVTPKERAYRNLRATCGHLRTGDRKCLADAQKRSQVSQVSCRSAQRYAQKYIKCSVCCRPTVNTGSVLVITFYLPYD